MMKTVYLVRHGESVINDRSTRIFKEADAELTALGRRQTELIAERARRIRFEALISSPFVRAHDTAKAIAAKTGHTIELSDLFTETRHPSSLNGRSVDEPDVHRSLLQWRRSVYEGGPKVEDGESFAEIRARAIKALHFLDAREEQSILVATHGGFLRFLMCHIIFGESLTPSEFGRFIAATRTANTGISVLSYEAMPDHENDASARWRIRVFNDHAHLG